MHSTRCSLTGLSDLLVVTQAQHCICVTTSTALHACVYYHVKANQALSRQNLRFWILHVQNCSQLGMRRVHMHAVL
jgi:hypothetical protein